MLEALLEFDYVDILTVICVFITFAISGLQVRNHLANYTNPFCQSKIITILFMPPIYAWLSSMTIWFHDHKQYLLFVRDIYESIVIYSFFELLRAYIAYDPAYDRVDETRIYKALGNKGEHHHTFPFSLFLKPMNLKTEEDGKNLFFQLKFGILQYIPVKIITAIIVIADLFAWFWSPGNSLVYYLCSAAVFVSVSLALYYLVLFFHTLHEELAPYKPLMKFLTIKGILFLTFWQEVALWMLGTPLKHSRFLPPAEQEDAEVTLGCLLVNFEMVLMAVLTSVAYNYKDFAGGVVHQTSLLGVLKDNFKDAANDLDQLKTGDTKKTQ
jgi:hypothetical protein